MSRIEKIKIFQININVYLLLPIVQYFYIVADVELEQVKLTPSFSVRKWVP